MDHRFKLLRLGFFACIVLPLTRVLIGLNLRNRHRLPQSGPAIVVANHNSHLDTAVLMSLFPLKILKQIRPVAAADYFLKNSLISFFSRNIMGIIPIRRSRVDRDEDPLAPLSEALNKGEIVIFFPEGSRGEPDVMVKFKKGISILAERHPEIPIYPVFLNGLGRMLPKGEALLVPLFCDVVIGEAKSWTGNRDHFLFSLEEYFKELAKEAEPPSFEDLLAEVRELQ